VLLSLCSFRKHTIFSLRAASKCETTDKKDDKKAHPHMMFVFFFLWIGCALPPTGSRASQTLVDVGIEKRDHLVTNITNAVKRDPVVGTLVDGGGLGDFARRVAMKKAKNAVGLYLGPLLKSENSDSDSDEQRSEGTTPRNKETDDEAAKPKLLSAGFLGPLMGTVPGTALVPGVFYRAHIYKVDNSNLQSYVIQQEHLLELNDVLVFVPHIGKSVGKVRWQDAEKGERLTIGHCDWKVVRLDEGDAVAGDLQVFTLRHDPSLYNFNEPSILGIPVPRYAHFYYAANKDVL